MKIKPDQTCQEDCAHPTNLPQGHLKSLFSVCEHHSVMWSCKEINQCWKGKAGKCSQENHSLEAAVVARKFAAVLGHTEKWRYLVLSYCTSFQSWEQDLNKFDWSNQIKWRCHSKSNSTAGQTRGHKLDFASSACLLYVKRQMDLYIHSKVWFAKINTRNYIF